jgi:hypothetical protein
MNSFRTNDAFSKRYAYDYRNRNRIPSPAHD